MSNIEAIRFTASVNKVQTMVDGGLRVVLDFPENAIETASALMKVKSNGWLLEIAAVPFQQVIVASVKQEESKNAQTLIPTRSEWES